MEDSSKGVQGVHPSRRTSSDSGDRFHQQIRVLLRRAPLAGVEALIDSLDRAVYFFCPGERRETTTRALGEIKRDLRPIVGQIDKLLTSLRGLSEDVLHEMDFEICPGFEMPEHFLAAERPFVWRNPYEPSALGEPEPPKPRPPVPQGTYYVDPVIVTLRRLREGIQTTLNDRRSKGGAPRRFAWHFLASDVAQAMQRHLDMEPSATSGPFEELLRACLEVGLTEIRSDATVPDDLRPYMLSALDYLKQPVPDYLKRLVSSMEPSGARKVPRVT